MKIKLDVTQEELEEAARIVSGSPHPDDYEQVVETFLEMVRNLERLQLGEGPEGGIPQEPREEL